MKLTWHMVKKDLWRNRWVIGALAGVIVVKIMVAIRAFGSELTFATGSLWIARSVPLGSLAVGLETLLSYLLVAAFIHEDRTDAVIADWKTRPISGSRLLGAKLFGLMVVIGVLPVLVLLPWWLSSGYGWSEMTRALGETWAWQAALLVVALPLASLTGNYGRFLMWTVVVLIAGVTFFMIMVAWRIWPPTPPEWVATRWWLATGLAFATAGTVTTHQFVTRRLRESVALFAGGCGAVMLAAALVSSTWGMREITKPGFDTEAITLSAMKAQFRHLPGGNVIVKVPLQTKGVPATYALEGATMKQRWTFPDGTKLETTAIIANEPIVNAKRRLGFSSASEANPLPSLFAEVTLTEAQALRLQTESVTLQGDAAFRLHHVEPEWESQVRVGEHWKDGATTGRIVSVRRSNGAILIIVMERYPVFARSDGPAFGVNIEISWFGGNFWLLDRASGWIANVEGANSRAIRVGTVEIRRTVLRLSPDSRWAESVSMENIERQLGSMTLAKITSIGSSKLTLTVKPERLIMAR
jgi:hypothetical protein